jgi:hypothetical protein
VTALAGARGNGRLYLAGGVGVVHPLGLARPECADSGKRARFLQRLIQGAGDRVTAGQKRHDQRELQARLGLDLLPDLHKRAGAMVRVSL